MNENDYITGFDLFYGVYPKKSSKGAARKTWLKMTKGMSREDFDNHVRKLCLAVESHIRARKRLNDKGAFVADWKLPATWLNAECWLDDVGDFEEKDRARIKLGQCSHPQCQNEIHGPQFRRCEVHINLTDDGKLTHSSADLLRGYYKDHPEIQQLRGKEAIVFIKQKIDQLGW